MQTVFPQTKKFSAHQYSYLWHQSWPASKPSTRLSSRPNHTPLLCCLHFGWGCILHLEPNGTVGRCHDHRVAPGFCVSSGHQGNAFASMPRMDDLGVHVCMCSCVYTAFTFTLMLVACDAELTEWTNLLPTTTFPGYLLPGALHGHCCTALHFSHPSFFMLVLHQSLKTSCHQTPFLVGSEDA